MGTYVVGDIGLSMAIQVVEIVVGDLAVVKGGGRGSLFAEVTGTVVDHVGRVKQVSVIARNACSKGIQVGFPFSMDLDVFSRGQVPPEVGSCVSLARTARAQAERGGFVHVDPDLQP